MQGCAPRMPRFGLIKTLPGVKLVGREHYIIIIMIRIMQRSEKTQKKRRKRKDIACRMQAKEVLTHGERNELANQHAPLFV
eukprot:16427542-Heterocapsa_arctica.AAC.1